MIVHFDTFNLSFGKSRNLNNVLSLFFLTKIYKGLDFAIQKYFCLTNLELEEKNLKKLYFFWSKKHYLKEQFV